MQLYIANGTHQHFNCMYRLPGIPQPRSQTIPVGGQIKISGDLTKAQVDAIVNQFTKYGMIEAEEIDAKNGPAPLAYRVGNPISAMMIEVLTQRNKGVLVARGHETRKNAAIVMASQLGTNMREQGVTGDLDEVEVDITEEAGRGAKAAGEELLVEKTVVRREDNPRSRNSRRR